MDFWSNLCEFLFRDAAQNFLEEVTTIVFMCDTTSFFCQIDQNWQQYTEPELGFPRDGTKPLSQKNKKQEKDVLKQEKDVLKQEKDVLEQKKMF